MITADVGRAGASNTRPAVWWLLVGLEVVIAVNAVYGGIGLMVNGMGMPADWLDATPFRSWELPGVILLIVVAVSMSIAAVGELARWRLAYLASITAGLVLIGWIAAQVLVLRRYFFLQPVLGVAGALVVGLAWWAHRRRERLTSAHQRRRSR
jgi:hypothetical protein